MITHKIPSVDGRKGGRHFGPIVTNWYPFSGLTGGGNKCVRLVLKVKGQGYSF